MGLFVEMDKHNYFLQNTAVQQQFSHSASNMCGNAVAQTNHDAV